MPEGFSSVIIEVTRPDGSVVEWCVLLADTPQDRARGLMEVDSLGGYDGMLFSFEEESFGSFYMLQTRIPLSIAFIAADGSFVSSTDMEPCPDDDDDPPCPRYAADAPYLHGPGSAAGRPRRAGDRSRRDGAPRSTGRC